MSFFHRSEHPPIGLEIIPTGVRMLQVLNSDEGASVVALARSIPASRTSAHASANGIRNAIALAKTMLGDAPFVGRRVVAAIPDELAQIRTIRLPATEADPVPSETLIRHAAIPAFPADLNSSHFQYMYAGKTRSGSELRHEIIAVACPSDRMARFAIDLDRAGFKTVSVDVAPCSIYRGIAWNAAQGDRACAIVELGDDRTRVIIGQGSQVRFIKTIDIGTAQLRDSVSRRLGITPEEAGQLRRRLAGPDAAGSAEREPVRKAVRQACRAILETLAGEVVPCLRYYRVAFRGPQPERLLLVGSDADDPQTVSTLATATCMDTQPARPLQGLDLSRFAMGDRDGAMSGWALPLGLAVRAMPARSGQLKLAA
jgi:type IV pilus assembly protein PilM